MFDKLGEIERDWENMSFVFLGLRVFSKIWFGVEII